MSSEGNKSCPLCGGLGFVFTEKGAKRCRCVYERFNLGKYLNIPKRFWDADIRQVRQTLDRKTLATLYGYLKDFKTFYRKGVGLLLVGEQGVGKTYIVSAVLKYLYTKYRIKGLFTDTKELSIKLRESFAEKGASEIIESLARVPILVLDDLGNEVLTDWYREILTGLISRRYNEKKVTFITTNYYPSYLVGRASEGQSLGRGVKVISRAERGINFPKLNAVSEEMLLDKRFGSHMVSRLGEMTIPIVVLGRDKRLQKVVI